MLQGFLWWMESVIGFHCKFDLSFYPFDVQERINMSAKIQYMSLLQASFYSFSWHPRHSTDYLCCLFGWLSLYEIGLLLSKWSGWGVQICYASYIRLVGKE
jgi:hypothetical protein